MQVQVVVSWDNDIIGRLARKIGVKWSHAAIMSKAEMSDDWWIHEAIWKGIVFRPWEEFEESKEEIKIFETKTTLPQFHAREIVAFASGNVGRPYDFGLLLKIAWECLRKYFGLGIVTFRSHVCSTLVHSSFKYAGIDLVPGVEIVLPDDLAESGLFKDAT